MSYLDFEAVSFLEQLGNKIQKDHYLKEILELYFEHSEQILADIQLSLAVKDYSKTNFLKALVKNI